MLHLATDADVHGHVIRGLRLRNPEMDLIRVQEAGLRTAEDAAILEWAASENRIVITQDRSTMIQAARDRIQTTIPMPGLLVIRKGSTVAQAIEAILMVDFCSEQFEWRDQIEFLPL